MARLSGPLVPTIIVPIIENTYAQEFGDCMGENEDGGLMNLVVGSIIAPDNSDLALNKATMETLKVSYGDSVLVQGKGHINMTLLNVCIAAVEDDHASLSKDTRKSLQVDTSDTIIIHLYKHPPEVSLHP